jgi:hypothetical protein
MPTFYRSIVPAEQHFLMGEANYVVLDESKIVEVPIRTFGWGRESCGDDS